MGDNNTNKQDTTTSAAGALSLEQDLFGGVEPEKTKITPQARMAVVCNADKSGGIEVSAGFRQVNNTIKMELEFHNISSPVPVSSLAIQLNKNSFGLSPASQQIVCNPAIAAGNKGHSSVELVVNPTMLAPKTEGQPATPQVQVAIKNMGTGTVFYFAANFNLEALFSGEGALDRSTFIESWKKIDDRKELYSTVSELPTATIEEVMEKFAAHHVFFIARRPVPNAVGQEVVYFSMKTVTGMTFLAELTFKEGVNACKVCLKTESIAYGVLAKVALENLLKH